jgi:hypothetical protein
MFNGLHYTQSDGVSQFTFDSETEPTTWRTTVNNSQHATSMITDLQLSTTASTRSTKEAANKKAARIGKCHRKYKMVGRQRSRASLNNGSQAERD